jgi:glycine oxidase
VKALVIGGGIIGSSVAWRLAREGVNVTVLERGRLGQEASWAAAGMIAPQAEAHAPGPFFDLCLRAREAFEAAVDRLAAESGVDPEYDSEGILYVALDAAERRELEERARWQHQAGAVVEELTASEARKLEPAISPEVAYALYFPDNRRTENRKLTQAYANSAAGAGATFVEGARVDSLIVKNGTASGVRMDYGVTHDADVIINAAGSWAGQVRGLESDHVEIHPVRGQIVCFEGRPGILKPSVFSLRGYVVPRRDGRLLAGSTMEEAGFNKSVTFAGMQTILRGVGEMVPSLGAMPFREAWAGLRPATKDLMPVYGASPSVANVFYAAGLFRSGILLSALTGEILADLVMGRKPVIDLTPFSPARFKSTTAR